MPFLIAFGFIFIGIILVYNARKSLSTGEAETEDNGIIYKNKKSIRFFLFVITQLLFGFFAIIVGTAIIVAINFLK